MHLHVRLQRRDAADVVLYTANLTLSTHERGSHEDRLVEWFLFSCQLVKPVSTTAGTRLASFFGVESRGNDNDGDDGRPESVGLFLSLVHRRRPHGRLLDNRVSSHSLPKFHPWRGVRPIIGYRLGLARVYSLASIWCYGGQEECPNQITEWPILSTSPPDSPFLPVSKSAHQILPFAPTGVSPALTASYETPKGVRTTPYSAELYGQCKRGKERVPPPVPTH